MKINSELMVLRRKLGCYYWRRFKEINFMDLRKRGVARVR